MAGAAATLWFADLALAADASYCVTCKNPDQVYRCRVEGAGQKPADAVKLYCIIRTAKEGQHASCSVEKTAAACAGIEKVYAYDGPAIPAELASDPRVRGLADKVQQNHQAFAKPEGKAPKTLFELGGRAVNASRTGIKNARARLGGTSPAGNQEVAPVGEPVPLAAPAQGAAPPAADMTAPVETTVAASSDVASETRIQRAGTAVGGFARKSYRCVRSFFRSCGEEPAEALR
jgi:hypothetical protein